MKLLFLLLIVLGGSFKTFAQPTSNSVHASVIWKHQGGMLHSKDYEKRAEKVKNSTLCVCIDDQESELGKETMKAFNSYWKFSKYKFIKTSEYGNYISDENNSMFLFAGSDGQIGNHTNWKISPNLKSNCYEYGYVIFLGTKKDKSVMGPTIALAGYVEVYSSVYGAGIATGIDIVPKDAVEKILEASTHLTPFFVLRMQQSLNDAINIVNNVPYKFTETTNAETDEGETKIKFINVQSSIISNKKIFLLDSIADERSRAHLMKAFNLSADKISIVSAREMNKQLEKGEKDDIYIYDLISNQPVGYSYSGEILFIISDRITYKHLPNRRKKK